MRYFKLLNIFITNSFQVELEYRIGLLFGFLNSFAYTALGALIIFTMFQRAESVGDWSFYEAMTLFGVFMFIEAIFFIVISPNLWRITQLIGTGNMDFYLIKPLSSQFISSLRTYHFWTFPQLILGLLVIFYSANKSGSFALQNVALTFIFLASAIAILYSIGLMFSSLSFWFVKIGNLYYILISIITAARVPTSAYPKPLAVLFSTLLPIVFITTVPAQAALGKLSIPMAVASIAVSVGLLVVSHLFWRYGVAHYSSASS